MYLLASSLSHFTRLSVNRVLASFFFLLHVLPLDSDFKIRLCFTKPNDANQVTDFSENHATCLLHAKGN